MKLNTSIRLAANLIFLNKRFGHRSEMTTVLLYLINLLYHISTVYVNLQLKIDEPHENHFEVDGTSSLTICIVNYLLFARTSIYSA